MQKINYHLERNLSFILKLSHGKRHRTKFYIRKAVNCVKIMFNSFEFKVNVNCSEEEEVVTG